MKVIIIGHSYLAEENRKNLTELAKKVDLEVISPHTSDGMIFKYDMRDNVINGNGWKIKLYKKWIPPKFPSAVYFLCSFNLRNLKPDILHIESDPFTPLFIQFFLLSRILVPNVKIVCTVKQNTYTSRGLMLDWIKDSIARILVPKVDHFITVNSGVKKIYHERFGASPNKMTYCTQLGIDTSLFAPIKDNSRQKYLSKLSLNKGDFLIGYCGRLVEYKGVLELIEAVDILRMETGQNLHLALLGDGPLKASLSQKSKKCDWFQLVDVLPHARVSEFLKCLDVFVMPPRVLPYHIEHDAHALLEAMACGTPCIGTASGAISDILQGAGIVIEPENPHFIKSAILELMKNETLRNKLSKRARNLIIKKYSIEAVAKIYCHVYHKVIENLNN